MRSDTQSVSDYLAELPEDRASVIAELRALVLANIPPGYEEAMNWGMITYQVPLSTFADTYNKQPLMYVALSSQKNYMSLYLTAPYWNEELLTQFKKAAADLGKKLDMGKSCIRFKTIDDLPLSIIAESIASVSVDDFIAAYKVARKQ